MSMYLLVTAYYRLTLTVKEPWFEEYANRHSSEFKRISTSLAEAIDKLYESFPGRQSAAVVRIQSVSRHIYRYYQFCYIELLTKPLYSYVLLFIYLYRS